MFKISQIVSFNLAQKSLHSKVTTSTPSVHPQFNLTYLFALQSVRRVILLWLKLPQNICKLMPLTY